MEEKLNWLKQFVNFVGYRFGRDRCPSIAAELTVTSLLALVPLLTVIFSLLTLFPQFQNMEAQVQSWLFENFIPESSQAIEGYLNRYINNTRGLTFLGMTVLIVTSLMLMRTIDKSFNHIWQVKQKNSAVRVFLVYWAVLTMGPLLLAASLAVSSYFASLPLISDVVKFEGGIIKRGVPLLMTLIAFTVMFIAVPNRRVSIRHAIIAAVITAIMFETAKIGFGIFVQKFSTYQLIFGALAAVPLFLIWVLLSWMILLMGAEICHALEVFQPKEQNDSGHPFIIASRVLKLMIQWQQQRRFVDTQALSSAMPRVRTDDLAHVLERLQSANLIVAVENGGYSLVGDSQDYRLSDLLNAGIQDIPDQKTLDLLAKTDEDLAAKIAAGRQALVERLNDPLGDAPNRD